MDFLSLRLQRERNWEREEESQVGKWEESRMERQNGEEKEIENEDRNGITKNLSYAYADTRSSLFASARVFAKDLAILKRSSSTIYSIDSQLVRSIILSSPPLPHHHSWEPVSATAD